MNTYRKLAILILSLILLASAALAENFGEAAWYELSADESVLTLRLPVTDDAGWSFEISKPQTVELLTLEIVGDEPGEDAAEKQWVASFRPIFEQFGSVEIACMNASADTYTIDLYVVENGQIQIVDSRSPEEFEDAYVLATASVNLRREPGTQAESIGTVQADAELAWRGRTAVDARGMIWYEVAWKQNASAWVSAKHCKLMNADLIVEVTGSQVNVRNQPGLDGDVVDVLSRGETALYLNGCELDERDVAWYSVRTSGGPCWVSSKYVKIR